MNNHVRVGFQMMNKALLKKLVLLGIILGSGVFLGMAGWNLHRIQTIKDAAPGYLGVTLGFTATTRSGGPYTNRDNHIYNLPMYLPTGNVSQFWDDIVEQLVYAGVDFVAPTIRGHVAGQVNEAGDPRLLSGLVDAIYRRGVQDRLKVSCLDDIPASWTAVKNLEKHASYSYIVPFDLADVDGTGEGGYKYAWDQNLRDFFLTIPDELRFKIDGRPVIYNWGVGDYAFSNYHGGGHAANLLRFIKERCQDEFGFDPYLIADKTWITRTGDPGIHHYIDGVHAWFGVGNTAQAGWSNYLYKDRFFGVCVPEFRFVSESEGVYMEIVPDHGRTFERNLASTVGDGAYVTLVEGFTDWEENAGLWRARDGPYAETHHDYPSQRLNLLRKHSRDPFPVALRLEAEACDVYHDATPGNSGGAYRAGDLDISAHDGTPGWFVHDTQATEWLKWCNIPLNANCRITVRAATSDANAIVRLRITRHADELLREFNMPDTEGFDAWNAMDLGAFALGGQAHYNITLEVTSGSPRIDCLDISASP